MPWDEAKVHVLTHTLHYGSGVFEGIRAYATADGPAVFRLKDHIDRLLRLRAPAPHGHPVLAGGDRRGVQGHRAGQRPRLLLRPADRVPRATARSGLNPLPCPVNVSIAVWPWGSYLGEESLSAGVRMMVSSWRRMDPNVNPVAAKGTGIYINSSLAKIEAIKSGYDEAILLNTQGFVSECTGENVFIVKNGVLITPPLSSGALDGHHARLRHDDRARLRVRGARGQPAAQRPLPRRRGVPHGNGRRGRADPVGRRPRDRPRRRDHAQDPGDLLRGVHGEVERYRDWFDYVR